MPKGAAKSPKKSPDRPGGKGGMLLTGNPGNKGGGRKADEFKAKMAELVSADSVSLYMQECLAGVHGPKAFIAAVNFAAERGYGREPQAMKLTGDASEPLVIRVVTA